MIAVITSVVNWISKYYKMVAIGFIGILIATIFFMASQLKKKDVEIARVLNNERYYESLVSNTADKNRVLQLTVGDLHTSKDSLIQEVVKAKKKLKIKDKDLIQAQVINTEVKDTAKVVLQTGAIDFSQKLELNDLTTIIVSRKDSILQAVLDLKNQQILFINKEREYRNRYRNGFIRFFHFDWKKDETYKYQIVNSNSLIKVIGTRIVTVPK